MSKCFDNIDAAVEAEEFAYWLVQDNFDTLMLRYDADLAESVINTIIAKITDRPSRRVALRMKVGRVERDLAGPAPSPIERVLAERVAVCYLDSYHCDLLAGSNSNMFSGDYYQRWQDRAQRRYL